MSHFRNIPIAAFGFILTASAALAADPPSAEELALGKANYEDFCASCHAINGVGDIGPKISSTAKLADGAFVVHQISKGSGEMPGFEDVLSKEEIIGIANYIRTNFGNDYGYISEEDIEPKAP